jgi:hypothetical protein
VRLGVAGEADDADRAPVEVALGDDDLGATLGDALDPVAPLAGELERGLDALGAGVHRQDHVLAGELGELGAERAELIVVEGAAGERHAVQLLRGGRDHVGVAVAEVEGRVAGEAVEDSADRPCR